MQIEIRVGGCDGPIIPDALAICCAIAHYYTGNSPCRFHNTCYTCTLIDLMLSGF